MALEIEIELGGVCNVAIDDSTSWAIAASIGLPRVLREKSDMVPFPNYDNGDGRFDF